jgi:hypothetical protein
MSLLGQRGQVCGTALCDTRSSLLVRRWPPDLVSERLEILHDGREVELVARAGEPSQTHALKAMVNLQVREAHLYFLRSFLDCSNSGVL